MKSEVCALYRCICWVSMNIPHIYGMCVCGTCVCHSCLWVVYAVHVYVIYVSFTCVTTWPMYRVHVYVMHVCSDFVCDVCMLYMCVLPSYIEVVYEPVCTCFPCFCLYDGFQICMSMCLFVCRYLGMLKCLSLWTSLFLYVCQCLCMHVAMCRHVYIYIHTLFCYMLAEAMVFWMIRHTSVLFQVGNC
jgi:hypothetical protein